MRSWVDASKQLPDDDTTVLLYMPDSPGEPIWFGYHDGDDGWRSMDGMPCVDEFRVSHWMHLPDPPEVPHG